MRSNPQPDRIISAQKIFLRRGTLEASLLTDLLSRWPLIQLLRAGADGTVSEAMSEHTRKLRPKHDGAEVTPSMCPFCDEGGVLLVYHKNGKLISIEGDQNSPISRGRVCPRGADTY